MIHWRSWRIPLWLWPCVQESKGQGRIWLWIVGRRLRSLGSCLVDDYNAPHVGISAPRSSGIVGARGRACHAVIQYLSTSDVYRSRPSWVTSTLVIGSTHATGKCNSRWARHLLLMRWLHLRLDLDSTPFDVEWQSNRCRMVWNRCSRNHRLKRVCRSCCEECIAEWTSVNKCSLYIML